jgi:ABC-type Mn2+/Zn2+ transport system permease subunit
LSVIAGIFFALLLDVPAGASIVLVSFVVFLLTLVVKKLTH